MADADLSRAVRFGLFELDLRASELRKNGVKIKLQEKPLGFASRRARAGRHRFAGRLGHL